MTDSLEARAREKAHDLIHPGSEYTTIGEWCKRVGKKHCQTCDALTKMGVWGIIQDRVVYCGCGKSQAEICVDCMDERESLVYSTTRDRLVRQVREMVEKGQTGPLAMLKALEDGE